MNTPAILEDDELGYNAQDLARELDRTKAKVFLGSNAAFLGSIMSSMDFCWSRSIPTAATDGVTFWWNPDWFMEIPEDGRKTVLVHELMHAALLHRIRRGDREPRIWNIACDYRINYDLKTDGYSFDKLGGCLDMTVGMAAEEDLYDLLIQNTPPPPTLKAGFTKPCQNGLGGQGQPIPGSGDVEDQIEGDLIPTGPETKATAINNVVRAIHQAKLAGQAGNLPGNIEQIVETFLAPVIPWEAELYQFFTDMLDDDYTWRRPSRRSLDVYLPSRFTDDGRLEHLIYYLDVSGSISNHDIVRFNSEVKYIKDVFNPVKLTLVQFDHGIRDELVIEEHDAFEKVKVVGRGSTDLRQVREHIIKHQPTAAIIFTDLYVAPMEPLPFDVPVLWVVPESGSKTIPFGKLINIVEKQRL